MFSRQIPGSVAVTVDRGRGIHSSLNSSGAVSDGAGAGDRPFNLCLLCLLNVTVKRVARKKGLSYELFSNRESYLKVFQRLNPGYSGELRAVNAFSLMFLKVAKCC